MEKEGHLFYITLMISLIINFILWLKSGGFFTIHSAILILILSILFGYEDLYKKIKVKVR